MSDKTLLLQPLEHTNQDGFNRRKCKLIYLNGNQTVAEKVLWYEIPEVVPIPNDDDCDGFLTSILMDAMQEGRDINVLGSVSHELLSNLVEYQGAWHKWLPKIYQVIEISVENIRQKEEAHPGAVCAFSGGVDANFSVWRHSQKKNSYRSQDIKLCVMVHGFDIPLHDNNAFQQAFHTAQQTLADINIPLYEARTNFRDISKLSWEHTFTSALTSVLSNFRLMAGNCLIGSSSPYDGLTLPWGSNPVTDHLLSSGVFKILHDGATHNRLEKIAAISEWKEGSDNLRVCWSGKDKHKNCGKCEKCLRTMLCFLAQGQPVPKSFPQDHDLSEKLSKIQIRNAAVRSEWRQIQNYAISHNISGSWREAVDKLLNQKPSLNSKRLLDVVLPYHSGRRQFVRKLKKMLSKRPS